MSPDKRCIQSEDAQLSNARVHSANIDHFSQGYDYTVFRDENAIYYSINRHGEVVYGGPSALGVSDNEDLGKVLEETINNHDAGMPAVKLGSSEEIEEHHQIYSPLELNKVFTLRGAGMGRTRIRANVEDTVFTVDLTENNDLQWILQIADIWFGRGDMNTWFDFIGVSENILTNCEFRDHSDVAVKMDFANSATRNWNYITDCWFLNGPESLDIRQAEDLRVNGIRDDTDNGATFTDCEGVALSGNTWEVEPTFIDCEFSAQYGYRDLKAIDRWGVIDVKHNGYNIVSGDDQIAWVSDGYIRINPEQADLQFGGDGARIYYNDGDLVAENDAGETSNLT